MFYKIREKARKIVPVVVILFSFGQANAISVLDQAGQLESGNIHPPNTTYNPAGGGVGAWGQFQERGDTLVETGYMTKDSSGGYHWSGKNGVTTGDQFLACSSCQVQSETENLQHDWNYLQRNGSTDFIGKQGPGGVTYNESALLECAQQLGAGGCHQYLTTGQCTGAKACSNPHLDADIAKASQADASAITGNQNTQVDNSNLASGGTMSNGTALAGIETECSKEVSDALKQLGQQEVNGAQLLATQPGTGFTTANGKSPLSGDGSSDGENPFTIGSCLKSLQPGIGVSAIFGGSFLSSGGGGGGGGGGDDGTGIGASAVKNLMGQVKGNMCSALQSTVSKLLTPATSAINNAIGGAEGTLNGIQLPGPIGGYFPSLGAIVSSTGTSISAGQTSLDQAGLTVNGKNYGGSQLKGASKGFDTMGNPLEGTQVGNALNSASSSVDTVANKFLNTISDTAKHLTGQYTDADQAKIDAANSKEDATDAVTRKAYKSGQISQDEYHDRLHASYQQYRQDTKGVGDVF